MPFMAGISRSVMTRSMRAAASSVQASRPSVEAITS